MNPSELLIWLQERSILGTLPQPILESIVPHLQPKTFPVYHTLTAEDSPPDGLYILQDGYLESHGKRSTAAGLLSGTVVNLQPLLLNQPVQDTITTLGEVRVWFISPADFQDLAAQHPEIGALLSQQLAQEVEQLSEKLNLEQERLAILRPYLVNKAKRGIVGKSRYAVRLRSQIKEAAANHLSTIIFGEPGLEKDNIAALIHFGSPARHEAIIKVDCSTLSSSGSDLFGKVDGKMGLLEAVGEGTLVLNNIQELPRELIPPLRDLLRTNSYSPVSRYPGEKPAQKINSSRLIFISEKTIPEIDCLMGNSIKVPPLRVRKADIEEQINYYLSIIGRKRGIKRPKLTPEALRRLQAYDFPNNLRELENLAERAITQLDKSTIITEEIIWPSQTKNKQFRFNLLNGYPRLRQFLRSDWWPTRINYGFTVVAFALINIVLFVYPQRRSENFALNFFWAWWWPLILLSFPFLGRIWCSVCPFMIYGEITQKLSLYLFPRQLKKWPRETAQKYGGWFVYILFALILLWEELWNLEDTAYLSSCLLLLITAGAMIFSAIFERRFWCRYLCPIGAMNGMFAKLSITELRAQQGTCSAECTTYQCYKGGPQKGEGQETDGCPLYSHPAQLQDNRDCVLCMTCLKACPHRSVEFNLRPPGIELWTTHAPLTYEVALLFLLLGAVFLHHLPEVISGLNLSLNLSNFWTHAALATVVLFVPTTVPLLAHAWIKVLFPFISTLKPRRFVDLAYGYLPFVLCANIAHYLYLGLGEAGRILPVTFATFGSAGEGLPILVAHPAVISFLQGSVLILGVLSSIFLTQKIAKQPLRLLLPQHICTCILCLAVWSIVLPPSG
ncbi:MAG: Anaerobic nitric oxide reductase transcription regulator NorR [Chroococcopsis gigantea SAG 12.99]|jgi:transcriptional regulator with AAA-type ATPase domain/NAD-dependent dihydropyrimidine dehydrogenase PreA subunit|nr:4Fe-4S binding protein [Chlorogloea purpurea SAG 13.99]MDV3001703.1 Anaerobic nitric oxide reductase transcription regulator NorR [Chroococcopsis gigantea SAG 12.99]